MAAVLLPPGVSLRGDLEAGHTDLACRQRGKVKRALLATVNIWLHASVMDGIVTAITDREQIQNTMLHAEKYDIFLLIITNPSQYSPAFSRRYTYIEIAQAEYTHTESCFRPRFLVEDGRVDLVEAGVKKVLQGFSRGCGVEKIGDGHRPEHSSDGRGGACSGNCVGNDSIDVWSNYARADSLNVSFRRGSARTRRHIDR